MDTPIESRGSESTLKRCHAESAGAVPGVSSLAPGAQAVTRPNAKTVKAVGGRFIDDKLFFSTMSDELLNPDTAEMEARLRDIAARRRDRIRWHVGKHTAEMAIAALRRLPGYRKSAKCRRRKRLKRLL